MLSAVELEVPEPLRDCFEHCEIICVRDCCGIDAISQEPGLVTEWSRQAGHSDVLQALKQIESLSAKIQSRSRKVVVPFLNAAADGEVTQGLLLSFLQAFEAALRSCSMNEVLTVQEIEARYKEEWILVEDPEVTPQMVVTRGKVLYHSKDRDEVYQKAIELRPKHSAYLYTGRVAEGIVMML